MENAGTIDRDGFALRYRVEGAGASTALVIGSSIFYPRVFSESLRQSLQMVFIDHRGFAETSGAIETASFEMDVLVDDIEAVRQALGLEKVIIVGHSGHGYMALEYAKKYPEHVSHVVLIGLSPDSTPKSFSASDQYLMESVSPQRKAALVKSLSTMEDEIKAAPDRWVILYILRSGPRIWYDYNFDATFLWEGIKIVPEMFRYIWQVVFPQLDITRGLEMLNKPVFLALGRYDFWNPPALWDAVRPNFQDLTVRVFEQSGHMPQHEEPGLFDQELLEWLSQRSA